MPSWAPLAEAQVRDVDDSGSPMDQSKTGRKGTKATCLNLPSERGSAREDDLMAGASR